jgi:hypothetical protein
MPFGHASRVLGIYVDVPVSLKFPLVESGLTLPDCSLMRDDHSPSIAEVPDTAVAKAAEWWF